MALSALRSRRLLPAVSAFINHRLASSEVAPLVLSSPLREPPRSAPTSPLVQFQSRSFKSTALSFMSTRSMNRNDRDTDTLDPDAILFEGCDYNHWLITMDFPKDPKPTPEEMVETYVQTCAKGLNISVEEAKKKIYACSTTTYQGFQAVMTEAESEQFQGLPGVVFILPDSYIDPVNKEYGGDKYINGTIIPRPPPVQYNRGRNDRNRPRYDNQRGPPGNFNYQQGPMQGDGRNFGPPQNFSQQNYAPSRQVPPPPPPPGGFPQGGQGSNFNQPGQGNYYPQERRGPAPSDQRGFGPSERGEFGDNRSYAPPGGFQNSGPGPNQNFGSGAGGGFSLGARGEQGPNQGLGPGAGGGYGPGARGEQGPGQGFGPGIGGNYGQGGRVEQGPGHGFGPGAGGGNGPGPREQGPGVGGGYGPGARGEQGPGQGFGPGGGYGPRDGGDFGQGNQGR
uniref:MORF/ORRM1/DAG-like MORF domain-containing protein n=1 Tax=Kalanchoe fedtschenkoi TaxID=63787 RepID=A0A7N0UJQ7_KALFE